MNENKQLFKDTNPEAYSELKEAYVYNMELKLDELTADSEALGLFICKERQHHYIEPINQRSNPNYDIGCPVCKAELLNISLFKAKQRIYRHPNFDLVENLWICKKCRKAWWSSRLSDDYVVTSHKEYCISDDDSAKPLYQTHPSIAEEYSESNTYDLEWISYSGWYGFDEPLKWKCSKCNHEYDMLFKRKVSLGDRACPYCNGVLPTFEHSLAYLYPEIAEEWDKREQALKMSSKEIFGDIIGTRRAHGIETYGMIQCKRCGVIHLRKIEDVINEKCSFCDQGASLEWTEKVFREKGVYVSDEYYCEYKAEAIVETFTCEECGNVFTANLMQRLTKKYVCLGCENRKVVSTFNSLAVTHPELAKEWSSNNAKSANEVKKDSSYYALWICSVCKGEYTYYIKQRELGDNVCPYCNNKKVLPGYNSLDITHPQLVPEWSKNNIISVGNILKNKSFRALWMCQICSNEYLYDVSKREYGDNVCPYCNNLKVMPGYNSLDVTHPNLASQWSKNNSKKCNEIMKNSSLVALWICPTCNGEYWYQINKREENDNVCPYCNDLKVLPGYNSLDVTHPFLAKEWSTKNKKSARETHKKSIATAIWKCSSCNGEYVYPIYKREENNKACPYCNNKKVLAGYNSLEVTHPALAKQWSKNNSKKSNEVMKNSSLEALWICPICKGEYSYSINRREEGDNICPYCNNKKVLPGYNSFKKKYPELISEWDYTNNYLICDPDKILENYDKNVWWICNNCGSRYLMSPKRRVLLQKRKINACSYEKGYRRKKHYYFHL